MEHKKTNLKAFGLLESIIAIGVFGVTIIVGLSLIVKSLAIIKDNQVADQASAFVYTSLEYVRSPLLNPVNLTNGAYYRVDLDPNGEIIGITEIPTALALEANNSCNSTSDFFIDIDGPESSGTFCNQITVEYINPVDPLNSDFIIKSVGVYNVRDGYRLIEAIGFKSKTLL